uniref:Ankyrin repeat domain protein n=1 Tax=Colletotrichum fructicola (strain Nara gc5) TaxID=1213859 RepID=L2FHK8_COLFN
MSIQSLPDEIWLQIAEHLDSTPSIAALCRVNRRLCGILQRELFRDAIERDLPEIATTAAANGQLAVLKAAAAFGADLGRVRPVEPSVELLASFEQFGIDSFYSTTCWGTPLHLAARNGHMHVVKWLIEHGVNINAPARYLCHCVSNQQSSQWTMTKKIFSQRIAWTPLHHALCGGNGEIARYLILAGASYSMVVPATSPSWPDFDFEVDDDDEYDEPEERNIGRELWEPLVPYNWFDIKQTTEERTDRGPEDKMSTASKASPEIWLEIGYYIDSFHELAALARVNRMLYGIFQVDLYCKAVRQSCTEITVLAAAKGNLDTLKVAAAFGADLNRVYGIPPPIWNHDGSLEPIRIPLDQCWATPLHLAVQHGREEIVRWLVHVQKVKVNSPGRFLCPCMPAIVRLSMNYGGPRTSMGAWSSHSVWTPLHLAICQNHESIARELLENGGSHDTLIARENLPPFENGAWKVLSVPDRAYRPQMYARDHWKSVPNVKLPHIAALSGSEAIMTLVVRDLGGDVNAVDATAATPLHYAIIEKDEMMVRHLLSLGADPDCQQNHFQHSVPTGGMRWGALDFALRYDPRMASILLDHGASVWNPRLRSGPIESSLKNIICYHDVNAVPLDLRLFLRLTRQQERGRSLSTWLLSNFVSPRKRFRLRFSEPASLSLSVHKILKPSLMRESWSLEARQ